MVRKVWDADPARLRRLGLPAAAAASVLALLLSIGLLVRREPPMPHEVPPLPSPSAPQDHPPPRPSDTALGDEAIDRSAPRGVHSGDESDEPVEDPESDRGADRDTLQRGDLLAGMARVEEEVMRCYGTEGRGTVQLTVSGSGHVTGAKVAGPLAGTPAGRCVEGAVAQAWFRASKRDVTTLLWVLPLHNAR